jgi:hypothetical protein
MLDKKINLIIKKFQLLLTKINIIIINLIYQIYQIFNNYKVKQ